MKRNVLDYLEITAERVPGKIAICDRGTELTYGELLRGARAVGTAIASVTEAVNSPIPVLVDRRAEHFTAMLGILMSGNYYVPLERTMPSERLSAILGRLSPENILCAREDRERLESITGCRVLVMEEVAETECDPKLLAGRRGRVLDIDPVYMMFTSGSTGVPKGIAVSHRGVIDFTEWMTESVGLCETDRLGCQAPFYFDTSVKSLYPAMKLGAEVHVLEPKLFSFPKLLTAYLNDHEITAAIWSTSAFNLAAASGILERDPPRHVRIVAAGGEALQAKHLNRWRRALPEARYYNHYGPTEVTVDCAFYPIEREFSDGEPIPIGRACPNMEIVILTGSGEEAKNGEVGEICVRGSGLALGYYGDWEKTSAAFIQDPRNKFYPSTLYRTGDMGVMGEDGNIYFRAREDDQIKHMGHRIELGEVETALCAIPGVDAAVCFFDRERDRIICAHQSTLTAKELTLALAEKLPRYMIPNRFRAYDRLPLNANGKTDRVKIREDYDSEG